MQEQNDLATDGEEEDTYSHLRNAKRWLDMLADSEKVMKTWHDKCDNIEKQYANLERLSGESGEREMQMFWANMEVLKPSIYSRSPVPVVTARFKDRKPIVRHGAELLERSLHTALELDDTHETMKLSRDDLALNGRGVVWPRIKDYGDEQRICNEHLDRKDFRHGPARKWQEVPWVAKRTYNTREKLLKRFPDALKVIDGANFQARDHGSADEEKTGDKKAEVWELWHKELNVVVWVTPGTENVLEIRPPYLDLEGFFPCPKPAYATVQPGTLVPVPDFVFVSDQLAEINELTARISALSESLRMVGFYSAGNEDVGDAVEQALKSTDNNSLLIPVPNVAALGGAGMDKAIVWMPVDQVATVVTQLVALRRQIIEDVYEVTGISDIMRGSTDANETLGAQQLKSQYGSVRIRDKQEELIRQARDVVRIDAEMMAENFDADALMVMSQYDEVPRENAVHQQIAQIQQSLLSAANDPNVVAQARTNPQMAQQAIQQANNQIGELKQTITFEQVVAFLADQRLRPFVLDIETDSTIQPDENAQKQRVTEFIGALSQALQQLAPMIASEPQTAEFAGEVLKFAVSPFRAGRPLDTAIDDLVEQMKQRAGQPRQDPEAEARAMEAQAKQAEMQLKMTDLQMNMQKQQQESQIALEQARADLAKTNAEIEKIAAQIAQINAPKPELVASNA